MRIRLDRAPLLILLTCAVLAGAAPVPQSQEERIATLETRITNLEASGYGAITRLEQMNLDLDNTLEPLRVRLADYGEDMRAVESRLVALEEALALINERLGEIADGLAAGAGAPAGRLAAGTPMPPPIPPSGVSGPTVARPSRPTAPVEETRSEAETLYSSAYTDYLAANYLLAISGFEEYLRLFADADLADNARYWIGESHYSQQEFQLARTAFLEVARRHPRSETVPDALFKAARCLVEMGNTQQALEELVDLVRAHPRSDTVSIACLQIERLGGEKPRSCDAL